MKISKSFRKKRYNYELYKEIYPYAIFSQKRDSDIIIAYETVVLREHKERKIKEKILAYSLRFPSNEDWGRYGWTFSSIEMATNKFNELNGSLDHFTIPKEKAEDWY